MNTSGTGQLDFQRTFRQTHDDLAHDAGRPELDAPRNASTKDVLSEPSTVASRPQGAHALTQLLHPSSATKPLVSPYPPRPPTAEALIPSHLRPEEVAVYKTLLQVVAQREANGARPRPLVVITDIAKDYDDLAALTLLKELHRLRLVEVRAVVANLMPEQKRACFARGALDSLGLSQVPVACGTRGSPDDHAEHAYEFDCDFMARLDTPFETGEELLLRTFRAARQANEKLTLVCLSSLRDINAFAQQYPELVAEVIGEVHMQGGNEVSGSGDLEMDPTAANNKFDLAAAAQWHRFLQDKALPSHTYTKLAAYATPLTTQLYTELAATNHSVGVHLQRVQEAQDVQFYRGACDPATRFMPHLDQEWFLRERSSWYTHHRPDEVPPQGDDIVPYLTKVIIYDAIAALGAAGDDAIDALSVFKGARREVIGHAGRSSHVIYGTANDSGVHSERLALTMQALLKGALWDVQDSVQN